MRENTDVPEEIEESQIITITNSKIFFNLDGDVFSDSGLRNIIGIEYLEFIKNEIKNKEEEIKNIENTQAEAKGKELLEKKNEQLEKKKEQLKKEKEELEKTYKEKKKKKRYKIIRGEDEIASSARVEFLEEKEKEEGRRKKKYKGEELSPLLNPICSFNGTNYVFNNENNINFENVLSSEEKNEEEEYLKSKSNEKKGQTSSIALSFKNSNIDSDCGSLPKRAENVHTDKLDNISSTDTQEIHYFKTKAPSRNKINNTITPTSSQSTLFSSLSSSSNTINNNQNNILTSPQQTQTCYFKTKKKNNHFNIYNINIKK